MAVIKTPDSDFPDRKFVDMEFYKWLLSKNLKRPEMNYISLKKEYLAIQGFTMGIDTISHLDSSTMNRCIDLVWEKYNEEHSNV